jgi:DNA-directed RNA polymerase
MMMTVLATDLPAYAMIHDDFGTHAGNTDVLYEAIRVAFHDLYSKHDPLAEWAAQQPGEIAEPPERGDFDINEVLQAEFFFS